VPAARFYVIKGTPKRFVAQADSGNEITRAFCGDCGTPLYVQVATRSDVVGLRVCTLDDPAWFRPEADIFVRSAQPWEPVDAAVPQYPDYPQGKSYPYSGHSPCPAAPMCPRQWRPRRTALRFSAPCNAPPRPDVATLPRVAGRRRVLCVCYLDAHHGASHLYCGTTKLPLLLGDKLVLDVLMLILLLAAFAGAALYVRACLDLAHPARPPGRDVK
jgi:hypothetical protein